MWKQSSDCFTEDGVVESPVMGSFIRRAAIRDFAARNARMRQSGVQMRHAISNVQMDVEANRARFVLSVELLN